MPFKAWSVLWLALTKDRSVAFPNRPYFNLSILQILLAKLWNIKKEIGFRCWEYTKSWVQMVMTNWIPKEFKRIVSWMLIKFKKKIKFITFQPAFFKKWKQNTFYFWPYELSFLITRSSLTNFFLSSPTE